MIRLPHTEDSAMRSRAAYEVEPVADPMLPWADPYLVKLVQQLERETREQIEAIFREDEEDLDDCYLSDFVSTDQPTPRWSLDEAPEQHPYALGLN